MKRNEYKREPYPPRRYPYGYLDWMNNFWKECRKVGYVTEDSSPVDLGGLDMDSFLHYFLDGFAPREAVQEELCNL